MQYPLISEYVRAIQDASSNLDKLAHLVPVQDDHGEPYRSSGAFAVVFKMKDEQTGKCYALKCFTEEQEGRAEAYRQIADELEFVDTSYITSVKYLDKEIFVDSSCEEDEFPVLLMDWIDGETMESYIAENYQDNYAMAMLCYRFCKMAAWLRSQPFAHGDIKPDNIMVRPDGNLTLVDYDGMFVPAMKGQKSPTIGTKDFSHPLRTIDDFDESIDDFALASIALSLKAISLKPSLLDEYGAADRLLFSAEDYRDLSRCKILTALQELLSDNELSIFVSVFLLVYVKKAICLNTSVLFQINKPIMPDHILLGTSNTDDLWIDAIEDEFGCFYDSTGRKFLKANKELQGKYIVREGTQVICDNAFNGCINVEEIDLPSSVKEIGFMSFKNCQQIQFLWLPKELLSIGLASFCGCDNLMMLEIPSSVIKMENPFVGWNGPFFINSLTYNYSNGILIDKKNKMLVAFNMDAKQYCIPSYIRKIENGAFWGCKKIQKVVIPNSIIELGNWAFCACDNLTSIDLPSSIKTLGHSVFEACLRLKDISFQNDKMKIGRSAFFNCISISNEKKQELINKFGEQIFMGPKVIYKQTNQHII